MESDRQSTATSTPEEEFLNIDGDSDEDFAQVSDKSSLKMDDAKRKEKRDAVLSNQSQSAPVAKAADSEKHLDSVTPVASNSSLHLHDIKAAAAARNAFFDQARRGSLHKQRADSRMQVRSKLCQTDWSWEEDMKLLALYSESSFFSDLLSEMKEAEMKESLAKDFGRASDKSPFRAKQIRTGSEADGDDDFLPIGWEKEMSAQTEGSDEGWLTPFVKTISSVGPPQILQYQKESVFRRAACPRSPKEQTTTSYETLDEELRNYIFQLDNAARRTIVVQDSTSICQYCGKGASVDPYCCDAYRQHCEILRKSELSEYLTGKSSIDFKSQLLDGKHRKTRNGGGSTTEGGFLFRLKQLKSSVEKRTGQPKSSKEKQSGGQSKPSKEKQTGLRTKDKDQSKEKAVVKDHHRPRVIRGVSPSMVADVGMHLASNRNLVGPSTSLYQQGAGRQLKTISYQLSSKKCFEDGWTLSFLPSLVRSEPTEDYGDDLIQISRLKGSNNLFIRTYDNGNIFAVFFPDGSGTVFHPNGKVAISAVLFDEGLYTYIIQDDSEESKIQAIFQPDGHACIYFPDGRPRISLSPAGGLEIGRHGAKKRKWLWHDMYDQQQRAPLQPITVGITPECGIRIMSQGNITVTYKNDCKNIRLHVGTRLMLSNPQSRQAAPKDFHDQDEQFRKETKLHVATLINQILTILEFPKSQMLDNIPRPLNLFSSNRQKKYERSQVTT